MQIKLETIEGEYSICRLSPDAPIPEWAEAGFCSITRSENELSIVVKAGGIPEPLERENGWKMFRVAGSLDFSMVGVIAGISRVLADSVISIFVISTFETDYILVKSDQFDSAVTTLKTAGYEFNQ